MYTKNPDQICKLTANNPVFQFNDYFSMIASVSVKFSLNQTLFKYNKCTLFFRYFFIDIIMKDLPYCMDTCICSS